MAQPGASIVMRQQRDKLAAAQDVIGLLYEAAAYPDGWSEALDRVYRLFDAMAAHFFVWNKALDQPLASHGSTTYLGQQEALQYYLRIDPRRMLLARRPVGSTLLCHEHFDDAFVCRNEFFQDYSLPLGRRFLMATSLLQVGPNATLLALLRSPRQGPFEPINQALLERLRPHLERVARIHARLQQARHETELACDLVDGVSTCLFATDTMAFVVRTNEAAETMLRAGDALRIVAGRLVAESPAQTETLHRLISRAAASGADDPFDSVGMIIDSRSGGRHGLMVMPLNRRPTFLEKPGRPLALVTVSSLGQQTSPGRHLIEMFGLTAAESRLAAEIAAGRRLDVLAEEHRVRMTTLRTQLRAIYSKTGTSRQAELVHLVSRLGILRGGS
jgi:DNA-binding CsgD family transcriptional regulator